MFKILNPNEVESLAPIVAVMLPAAFALCICKAAFERIAGSPFLSTLNVSLLKKIQLFIYPIYTPEQIHLDLHFNSFNFYLI